MKLRRRTFRRLGAFLVVAVLVGLSALWLNGRGSRRQAQELLEERASGLQLLEVGDYEGALQQLTNFLVEGDPQRVEVDFEARLAHARARLGVFESGERHIEQAARLLSDLADDFSDDPRRLAAHHLLMQATAQGGDWAQLRRLSDEALESFPEDNVALRMRRLAAEQLGELSSALADSYRINDLAPQDIDEQLWTMRLMAWLGRPREAIVRHAVDLSERHPHDPRFLLVLAVAYRNAEQAQQAVACLRQAAQSELPENDRVQYVARLAGLFDAFGEHDLALEVYTDAVRRTDILSPDSGRLRQLLALRLWQAGRLEEALAVVPQLSREQRGGSVELVATRILLQFEHGDSAEASHSLALLGRSIEAGAVDPGALRLAIAWHEALSAAYAPAMAGKNRSVRDRLESLQKAFGRLRNDLKPASALTDEPAGLFLKWIGDLYSQLGETEQAIRHWRAAADHRAGWDEPFLLLAEAALAEGLVDQAERAVTEAAERAYSDNVERSQVLRVQVAYQQWLEAPSTGGALEAEALAALHQQKHPLDAQTLPIHVHMTVLSDPASARELILDRLQLGADAELRTELARVSMLAGLEMEQQLLSEAGSPEGATLWGRFLASRGRVSEAMEAVERGLTSSTAPDRIEWEIARARLLQQVDPPSAVALWQRIGAGAPGNVEVQLAILDDADPARLDRAFVADTIERLAQLTGPTGRRWRLEKARWLLAEKTPAAALDSADLLRGLIREAGGADTIDERILLAEALMIGGNERVAGEHLSVAFSLDRRRADAGLRLIGSLERSGRRDEAKRLLGRLAAEGVRGSRQQLEVASRLGDNGELDLAIRLLQQVARAGMLQPEGRIVLADLLQRSGRTAEARDILAAMVAAPFPPIEAILPAALFHHRQGEAEYAQEVLSLLEATPLADPEREVIRGSYYARIGEIETARNAFLKALRLAPGYPGPWREAMRFEMTCGNHAAALRIAGRAREAGLLDERLDALVVQAFAADSLPTTAEAPERLEALAAAVRDQPATSAWNKHAQAISQAAEALGEHRILTELQLSRLAQAAEVFDHDVTLLATLVEGYLATGEADGAARVARRLADAASQDPEAQRLAYESCRASGHQVEAEQYARQWQAVVPGRALAPDAAIAESLLLKGDFSGALTLLAPHRTEAGANAQVRALALAAEAHAGMGEYDVAFALVDPRLSRSAAWRSLATRLASDVIDDPAEAARWLNAVEAVTAQLGDLPVDLASTATADFTRERLNLAIAWARLGHRLKNAQALEHGRRQLAELTAESLKQDPDAWEALAEVAAWSDDQGGVEAAYRRVLALDPRRARAANHLARLLLGSDEPSDRAEALTWAAVAAEQVPVEPDYHDTLGRAYLAAGDLALAQPPFERALRLDDRHLDAMLGMATLLSRSGEREIASRWFKRLDPHYQQTDPSRSSLLAEYEDLKRQFAQPQQ